MAAVTLAFLAAHVVVLVVSQTAEVGGAMDVDLYGSWMDTAVTLGQWPVIHYDWVYPFAALIPMLITKGLSTAVHVSYVSAWWAMVTLLDFAVCALLLRAFGARRIMLPVSVWAIFIALMGSPGLMRLDGLVPPLVIVGLLLSFRHTTVAAAVLTVGAWIKVAPGAVVVPLIALARRRWPDVIVGGSAVCGVVAAVAFIFGANPRSLFGFFSGQSGRGLQIESVAATPIVVARAIRGEALAGYNDTLYTWEANGAVAPVLARVADFALPLLIALVAWFAYRARQHGRAALGVGALAALSAAIVGNKVGSPQFMDWLVGPVILGLAGSARSEFWRSMSVLVCTCAGLTHLIYPIAYDGFLSGNAGMVAVDVARNAIVVAIFVASLLKLRRLAGQVIIPRIAGP
jgi:hypothetical protein